MGKLDSLKIETAPLAFASFAAKHNALVDLLAGMVGENGISVVMAERNAIIRANIAAGNVNANVNFSNVSVVTSNGTLQNVLSNTVNSNTYPQRLEVRGVSNDRITINWDELAALKSDSTQYVAIQYGSIIMDAGSTSLEILAANVTQNMGIREIDVCSGNVAMKMLVLASAPYTP